MNKTLIASIKKPTSVPLHAFSAQPDMASCFALLPFDATQNLQSSNDSAEDSDIVEYVPLENGSFDLGKYKSLLQGGALSFP